MPVESGVAPAGPSMTAVPVLSPAGGSLGMPSLGTALDLRGTLPLLPAPVPGLVGRAMNFVGYTPEAAAVHPEAGASAVVPVRSPATARVRASDKTPALPAKTAPGAPSPAIALDRTAAASTLENGLSNPNIGSSALDHVQPEKAAGLGRSFFDQSNEKGRGALENKDASERHAPLVAATILEGGAFGPGSAGTARLSPRAAGSAFGAGHGQSQNALSYAPEGETLHDAVASAFPGAMSAGGAGAGVRQYGAVAPNGDLSSSAGSAVLPVLGAPRPLSLDLSRSGLIVRVRSALGGVMNVPAQEAVPLPRLAAPGPSTALLERGAMFEAFSVANTYADTLSIVRPLTAGVLHTASRAVPPAPAAGSSQAPLWWAWFILPLFVVAIRGIL